MASCDIMCSELVRLYTVHGLVAPVHSLVDPGHGTNLWDGAFLDGPAHKSVC